MDPPNSDRGRRRQIDSLVDRALRLPPKRRAAFVRRACGDDPSLRRAVEDLLERAEQEDSFLAPGSAAPTRVWDGLIAEASGREAERPGRRIGPYRLEEEIGRGGMAVAFRAVRVDGEFEQQVAFKLLRPGADSEEVLHRFRQERQILASLRHPNIAQLLDGGVTEDGRPFFVLELVEGLPIDRWCDEHGLGLEARLRLFVEVARAVEHAHRNLIVHRDLKPSNVLVSSTGQVKLLDFGIAKLEDPDTWPHAAPVTRTVMRLMTPEYASPEQVRGEHVTTATDVYQLGVVLFELLAGERPFRLGPGGQAELERRICDELPPRPSQAVAGDRTALARRLRGDLDTIVLTCLRKEPERRYASVAQLAADVERHLAGRPVTARPDTAVYRAGKFVRRHWAAVTAAAVALAVVATLGIAYTAGLAAARREAEAEARKSARVVAFLTGLFQLADPDRNPGESVRARDLLDRGRASIGRELAGEPRLRAEMLRVMGRIYFELGLFAEAQELFAEALALRRELGDPEPELAAIVSDLGWTEYYQSDFPAARAHLDEALAAVRAADPPDPEVEGVVLARLGLVMSETGEVAAMPLFATSLRRLEEALGPEDVALCLPLSHSAKLLSTLGDIAGARQAMERCLAISERHYGPDHPKVVTQLEELIEVVRREGRTAEAVELHERSTGIVRRVYGDDHPSAAISLTGLGLAQAADGDLESAAESYRQAIAIWERTRGADSLDVSFGLTNLADVLRDLGRDAEAQELYRRALEIRLERVGPDHSLVALVLFGQAVGHERAGDVGRAESLHRRALAIRRAYFPAGQFRIGESEAALGALLAGRGECSEAVPLLEAGSRILAIEPTEERWLLTAAEAALARCSLSDRAPS